MTDIFDQSHRSKIMASVKGKNTKIERLVRKMLFSKGYRYRLHRKDLFGRPDIVFPKYKVVVFINGCFWHLHGCKKSKIPETNSEWWFEKLSKNKERDRKNILKLKKLGWRCVTIWECSLKGNQNQLHDKLNEVCKQVEQFLSSNQKCKEI